MGPKGLSQCNNDVTAVFGDISSPTVGTAPDRGNHVHSATECVHYARCVSEYYI